MGMVLGAAENHAVTAGDEASWLDGFNRGDRAVLEQVYRTHFDHVRRQVARLVGDVEADAVVQELFLRLLQSADLRHGRGENAARTSQPAAAR